MEINCAKVSMTWIQSNQMSFKQLLIPKTSFLLFVVVHRIQRSASVY